MLTSYFVNIKNNDRVALKEGDSSMASPLETYVIRLIPGDDIAAKLQQFVSSHGLEAAFIITCVGSVTNARLRMANSETIRDLHGHYEIVSLVGTLNDGFHLHGSFSDGEGRVIGGHVSGALIVYTTAEIVIGNCTQLRLTREHDDKTGYPELVVTRKPN